MLGARTDKHINAVEQARKEISGSTVKSITYFIGLYSAVEKRFGVETALGEFYGQIQKT